MLEKLLTLFKKKNIELTEDEIKELELSSSSNSSSANGGINSGSSSSSESDAKKILERNAALEEHVKKLTEILTKEREQRESSIKTEQDRLKAEHSKKVTESVEKLFGDKKITEAQKAHWQKLFENNFEDAAEIAESLQPIGGTAAAQKTAAETGVGTLGKSISPAMKIMLERNEITNP